MSHDDRIYVNSVQVELMQDGNTLGTTEEVESLTIRLETQMPEEPFDGFAVLKTKGWSLDNGSRLAEIIESLMTTAAAFQTSINQG